MFSADRNGVKKQEHRVRSNPVSEGSKDLLAPTSLYVINRNQWKFENRETLFPGCDIIKKILFIKGGKIAFLSVLIVGGYKGYDPCCQIG